MTAGKSPSPASAAPDDELSAESEAPISPERDLSHLPPLGRDPAFIGMTATQFLGAFNDNLYKQLLLLIALDYKKIRGFESDPYQFIAMLAFAIPFVMLSGFAGYLSDKVRKRNVIVVCKTLEIVVMICATIAFTTGTIGSTALIVWLFVVLFFMGAQSALFGPSKFGILPEMLRDSDLPRANGIIQMTTFLAIIFGTALSGFLKQAMPNHLWVICVICIGIAILGTLTSLLIRVTPIANPGMKFSRDCLLIERSTREFIWRDHALLGTMMIYALFWFAGAVFMPTVNAVCKDQLEFPEQWSGLLLGVLSIGIAIGCVTCGKLSRDQVRFDLMRFAGWGLFVATALTSIACVLPLNNAGQHCILIGAALFVVGLFAGVFAVPPQVFIQSRPPETSKGRVIGAMNLFTWSGITAAAGYYYAFTLGLSLVGAVYSWTFLSIGVMFVVAVMLFKQPNAQLSHVK
ncbi:MAG: MFS transporter [Pirellulaceae bacterium]